MLTTGAASRSSWVTSGRYCAGSVSSCSRKTPSAVILPSAWRSAEHETASATGTRRAVARQADDAHVVTEVLTAELRADAERLGEAEHLLFELAVAKAATELVAGSGKRVEVARRRELGGLQRELGRRTADDEREVVRRARGGTERAELLVEPVHQRRGVEQRLRLLEQEALVRRAAALGHEQQLVRVAVDGFDLDLGGEVRAGVLLFVRGERRELRVPEVVFVVGAEDPARDRLAVATTRHDELALLALHDRGAGVLTRREDASGRDARVLQELHGDEAVVG